MLFPCARSDSKIPLTLFRDHALLVGIQHGLDRGDRRIEAAGDLAIGRLKATRARGLAIERGGEPRAVDTECMNLRAQGLFTAIGLTAALDSGVERIQRQSKALHRSIDCTLIAHRLARALEKPCGGRCLDRDSYVLRD